MCSHILASVSCGEKCLKTLHQRPLWLKKQVSQSSNDNFWVSNTHVYTGIYIYVSSLSKICRVTMGFLKTWTWLLALNKMPSPSGSCWIPKLVPEGRLLKTQFYPLTHSCGQGWSNSDSAASRPLAISKLEGSIWSIQDAFWGIMCLDCGGWGSAQVTSKCGSAQPS